MFSAGHDSKLGVDLFGKKLSVVFTPKKTLENPDLEANRNFIKNKKGGLRIF
jgi:hypothetical protein